MTILTVSDFCVSFCFFLKKTYLKIIRLLCNVNSPESCSILTKQNTEHKKQIHTRDSPNANFSSFLCVFVNERAATSSGACARLAKITTLKRSFLSLKKCLKCLLYISLNSNKKRYLSFERYQMKFI